MMLWVLLALVIVIAALSGIADLRRHRKDKATPGTVSGSIATLPSGKTYYEWHGRQDGAIAVCVHGLTTPSYVWDAVVEGLNLMGYRVLTYDLYGRGYSDRVSGQQDADFFIKQLDELLEDQGVDGGIFLLGYSMGAAIATSYCAKQPNMMERMVLLAPVGFGVKTNRLQDFIVKTPVIGDWLMGVLGGWMLRKAIAAEAEIPSKVPDIYSRQIKETYVRGFLPAVLSSMRHMLPRTQENLHRIIADADIPVAAIWGEADTVIPISGIGKLAEVNRAAYQTMIPDAPHALLYTHPDEVHKALQEFLREV